MGQEAYRLGREGTGLEGEGQSRSPAAHVLGVEAEREAPKSSLRSLKKKRGKMQILSGSTTFLLKKKKTHFCMHVNCIKIVPATQLVKNLPAVQKTPV